MVGQESPHASLHNEVMLGLKNACCRRVIALGLSALSIAMVYHVVVAKPAVLPWQSAGQTTTETVEKIDPAAIKRLEQVAAGDDWPAAVYAYCALAKADPRKHALTKDQAAYLNSWQQDHETEEDFGLRMGQLSKGSAKELRPFVMQALRDNRHMGDRSALLILAAWKDAEALPQIRQRIRTSDYRTIAAYLSIDDSQQAETDVLGRLRQGDQAGSDNHALLCGIAMASIPADRKAALLHAAGVKMQSPLAVPNAIQYRVHSIGEFLAPLMDQETDLWAMGGYCRFAVADKEKHFAPQVRRAMTILSGEPTLLDGGEHAKAETVAAGQVILDAVAAYDLREVVGDVRKLMDSNNAPIRAAAEAAGARLGVPGMIERLYDRLSGSTDDLRLAVKSLMSIQPANPEERAAREEAVLACLGKPSEGYALRVLVTCGGERSAKALESILDGDDAQRAVYAAWVLAQLPNKAAAEKALRRVAIFGMFQHEFYQQGPGLRFQIAPELDFHQMQWPDRRSNREGPVRIPAALFAPFTWDEAEQQYSVRCYQLTETIVSDVLNINMHLSLLSGDWELEAPGRLRMNESHLLLLKEIAAHDSKVGQLMVKGQAVPHFHYRQHAAKIIAAITKRKAVYLGLAGETLDSDVFPSPYPNQDQLLAKALVDQLQKARLLTEPQTDEQWDRLETWLAPLSCAKEDFGPQVLNAVRQEAQRRAVASQPSAPTTNP